MFNELFFSGSEDLRYPWISRDIIIRNPVSGIMYNLSRLYRSSLYGYNYSKEDSYV